MNGCEIHPASFRDPAGYIFKKDGVVFRCVTVRYQRDYDLLMASGLYEELTAAQQLIPHTEEPKSHFPVDEAWKILRPVQLKQWSYPYEWSFSQLKAAALLTLQLNLAGLKKGMILKDATSYNIQFVSGRPMLIDSLSFEQYEEGTQWKAFRQFCQHFLYPLLLQQYDTPFVPGWLMQYADGIPVQMAKALLPWKSRFSLLHYLYVHLPAKAAGRKAENSTSGKKLPANTVKNNLEFLSRAIEKMKPVQEKSHWSSYYSTTILNETYLQHKRQVVAEMLKTAAPVTVTDMGCNTGAFSIIASEYAAEVLAFDTDARSIDNLYQELLERKIDNVTPLVGSISQPAPATGWDNAEHASLLERAPADVVMALALVHHLALTENIPLGKMLGLFARLAKEYLIIEFVPKADPMAQLLLKNREDIFDGYTEAEFELEAASYFVIQRRVELEGSSRKIYLLKKNG